MRTRPMMESDIPAVKAIVKEAGYGFHWPEHGSLLLEASEVAVDDSDTVIMAAAAVRVPELFLACAPHGTIHPFVKMEAIRLLHESLRDTLTRKGYTEAFAFLPPEIERGHGRHLKKLFGWMATWKAYVVRDWKAG